jgi:IS5 family transposase
MRPTGPLPWKEVVLKALKESDREKLNRLVREAEVAIFLRRDKLGNSVERREELSSMAVATEALRAIRIHKLGETKPEESKDDRAFAKTA